MAGKQMKPKRFSVFKIICLAILCSLIGGAIVFSMSDKIRGLVKGRGSGSRPSKEYYSIKSMETELTKLKRTQLEGEVKRLRDEVAARERENAEMQIQLKLMQDGSRTKASAAKAKK